MTTIAVDGCTSQQINRDAAIKKVWRRLIPFLFVLYIFNYLDRINIGFAALSMNKDLLLTATTFGLANSIFYVGYVACEIPSNLLMVRYGARVWIARILVSWGLASAATMLVVGPNSLYLVRFLVGVLEAGFVPGVLLYLTYWIPNSHRARANGYLMMAQPVAMALGAGVSGLILDHLNGTWGLQGWRWLFLLEGLPAVILGVVAYVYLTDKPKNAAWLEETEKNTVTSMLADDQPSSRQARASVWKQVTEPKILLLALAYFCLVNTINANATWIPTIVREVLKAYSLSQVGFVTAIPADLRADPDAVVDPQFGPDAGARLARGRSPRHGGGRMAAGDLFSPARAAAGRFDLHGFRRVLRDVHVLDLAAVAFVGSGAAGGHRPDQRGRPVGVGREPGGDRLPAGCDRQFFRRAVLCHRPADRFRSRWS